MGQDTDATILFNGGLDKDSDIKAIHDGDYSDALNIQNVITDTAHEGLVTNVPGNLLVNNPYLPVTGRNKSVGTLEDNKGDSEIYFGFNSAGYHGIYRYWRHKGLNSLGVIEKLLQVKFPAAYTLEPNPLNFDEDHFITGVDLVGDLLFYTDYFNTPREINVVKANDTDKRKKFVVYFDADALSLLTASNYQLKVYDGTNVIISQVNFTSSAPDLPGRVKDLLAAYQQDATAVATFNLTNKSSFAEIEMTTPGNFFIELLDAAHPLTIVNLVVPDNFYPEHLPLVPQSYDYLSYELLERIKYPPKCEPTVAYKSDKTRSVNLVREKVFQFRCQYVYEDDSKSVLGAISTIPMPSQTCNQEISTQEDNYLEVDFSDPRLNNTSKMWKIKQVNIIVREHNEGDWQLAVELKPWEWGTKKQIYKFYNDGLYQSIDQTRAIQPYDTVGKLVKSQKIVDDRIFDGGIVEGYDKIPIDINLEVEYDNTALQQRPTYTVKGAVFIRNLRNQGGLVNPCLYNQPIFTRDSGSDEILFGGAVKQLFPISLDADFYDTGEIGDDGRQRFYDSPNVQGFIVYLAGTPYYGISKQYSFSTDHNSPASQYGPGNYFTAVSQNDRNRIRDFMFFNPTVGGQFPMVSGTYNQDPFGHGVGATAFGGGELGETIAAPPSHIFSTYEIHGVPEGKYVLRFADQFTTASDLADNKVNYQRSSLPVLEVHGLQGTECIIDVNAAAAVGGIIFVGRSVIADVAGLTVLSGYVTDQDNPNVNTGLYSSMITDTRIEKALIKFTPFNTGNELNNSMIQIYVSLPNSFETSLYWIHYHQAAITDHNGYFFLPIENPTGTDYSIDATGCSSGSHVMNLTTQRTKTSNATPVSSGSSTLGVIIGCWRNTDSAVTNYSRTYVTGNVLQQACMSCPTSTVAGVNVVIGHGGQQATDPQGDFSIPCYGDTPWFKIISTPIVKRMDTLVLNEGFSDCRIDFNLINSYLLQIPDIQQNTTGSVPPYEARLAFPQYYFPVPIFTVKIISLNVSVCGWKHGSDEIFGIAYYNLADQRTAVCISEQSKLHIPFYNEGTAWTSAMAGVATVKWSVNHAPPSWAKKWQWVRTKNLQLQDYLQFAIDEVFYYESMQVATAGGTPTSPSLGEIVRIGLNNLLYYKQSHPNTHIAYTFTKGDRIRFIRRASGSYYNYYGDFEILAVNTASGGEQLYYSNDVNMPPLAVGDLYEIYTPRLQTENNIFYEFGECYDVVPKIENGILRYVHDGQLTDQVFSPAPLYTTTLVQATGVFKTGNTYYRQRTMNVGVTLNPPPSPGVVRQVIEDPSISDFWDSEDESIGRTNTDQDDIGEINRPTAIRLSDPYIENTKTNGLSSFQPLNQKQLNTNYGLINRFMLLNDEVLMAICENSKIVTMYVDKSVLRQQSTGQLLVAISDEVVPQTNLLQRTYGTQYAESVAVNDENDVFMFDRNVAAVPRYTGNQLFDLGGVNVAQFIANAADELAQLPELKTKVLGVYDRYYDNYILTFPEPPVVFPHRAQATICIPDTLIVFHLRLKYQSTILVETDVTNVNNITTVIRNVINNGTTGWQASRNPVTGCVTVYAPVAGSSYNNSVVELTCSPIVIGDFTEVNYSYQLTGGTD